MDAATGRQHGAFETTTIDAAAVNGLGGMMISAFQDKGAVDQRLAEGLASDVLERVYGTAVATEARKRPTVEVVDAPPATETKPTAPMPAPTPGKAKQVPVAAAKPDQTAMLAVPAPAAR